MQIQLSPYVNFQGRVREAMEFYCGAVLSTPTRSIQAWNRTKDTDRTPALAYSRAASESCAAS